MENKKLKVRVLMNAGIFSEGQVLFVVPGEEEGYYEVVGGEDFDKFPGGTHSIFHTNFETVLDDDATDPVNHPAHYTTGKIEVIDFIEDKELNYHRGNAVKYIVRAGKKDPEKEVEDLEKAVWYMTREIDRLKLAKEIARLERKIVK